MKFLREYLDRIKPNFQEGGKWHAFRSVYEGFESFLFTPNTTSKSGVHIHDAVDSKRTMIMVVVALIPALLFGMYNVGYQHFLAVGQTQSFLSTFWFGFLAVMPCVIVSYVVGLGIEFTVAQWRGHEIQEGFLVSGMLIPLITPINTPLWMVAVATAFAVIFAKEVFGGTGMNIFNVALVTRAFLFFAYPAKMSGSEAFVRTGSVFGFGEGNVVEGFSGATPLGQLATATDTFSGIQSVIGEKLSTMDYIIGLIPGSVGETSVIAILIGAFILLLTGVASWKIMLSVFVGGGVMMSLLNAVGGSVAMQFSAIDHLFLGGFAFGAVFMATDPVTSARTETGKYIYGFLVGVLAMLVRVINPGYVEGMMLAILLMNAFAPLIDYFVVEANIKRRLKRATQK